MLKTSPDSPQYVGAVTDITAAKLAEEKLRLSERELRQVLDLAPQHVAVLGPNGSQPPQRRTPPGTWEVSISGGSAFSMIWSHCGFQGVPPSSTFLTSIGVGGTG